MNEYETGEAVSDWGLKWTDADKAQDRMCVYMCTEDCKDTRIYPSGNIRRMARMVVGFTKHATSSDATGANLAVVAKCPGCGELFWYHITNGMIATFVAHCPLWPAEQKNRFGTQ
ncbi:MAG: hypothetical protein WCP09_00270 [Candidatus Taylorbacteria bacterium]